MPDRHGSNPYPVLPFMTVVPGRRVEQKLHKTLGQAKNAILGMSHVPGRQSDTAAIYEYRGTPEIDVWVELYRVAPGTPKDQMPWVEQTPRVYEMTETRSQVRTIMVEARNRAEAEAKFQAGEFDATLWEGAPAARPFHSWWPR